jgi:hypothetical protein
MGWGGGAVGPEASADDGFCIGRSDGPGAEEPDCVLMVVNGLKVTVR